MYTAHQPQVVIPLQYSSGITVVSQSWYHYFHTQSCALALLTSSALPVSYTLADHLCVQSTYGAVNPARGEETLYYRCEAEKNGSQLFQCGHYRKGKCLWKNTKVGNWGLARWKNKAAVTTNSP